MAPFRRKTARNLALAEAALALAKDRGSAKRRGGKGKLVLLGGAVAAAGAAVLLKKDKVAGMLPSRTGDAPAPSPAPTPPQPSNYDVRGPVANTSTPIPAPDHQQAPPAETPPADDVPAPPPIDEAAEEAAAAAEAAAIGGTPEQYTGEDRDIAADEAFRPLAEAGEGEAEGQEQAEADLEENATYRDAGMSDAERQIEDAIEQQDEPWTGETPEPLVSEEPGGTASSEAAAAEETPAEQQTFLPPTAPEPELVEETEPERTEPEPEPEPQATPEPEAAPEPAGASDDLGAEAATRKDDDDDWRTWSGQAVKP